MKRAMIALLLAGCAGSAPAVSSPGRVTADAESVADHALACWLGPSWSDALGEPPEALAASNFAQCRHVLAEVYGTVDPIRLEQLRALEAGTVADVVRTISQGTSDSRRGSPRMLAILIEKVAAAQRENLYARRAADRIKIDRDQDRGPSKLSSDELAAVPALAAQDGLRALLGLDAGPYTHDARLLGLLTAMDRLRSAEGLPSHMKLHAVAPVGAVLFELPLPSLTPEVPRSVWLDYLTRLAAAAGHAVPIDTRDAAEQKLLAWSGVLEGFVDRMLAEGDARSPSLRAVVGGTARRLHAEYTGARNYHAHLGPARTP
jgi:hypothetical protein